MGNYFDLHSHMLCRVDDGAGSEEEMYRMLDRSYADGVRGLCLTPHFSPAMFGDTRERSQEAFALLQAYAKEHYPDLELFLGNELGYYDGCQRALEAGICRTIAGSRYVLVDFSEYVGFFNLRTGVGLLQRSGYKVILAHAERYRCLFHQMDWIESFVAAGGVIQLNASSVEGSWGFGAKRQWKKLMRQGLAHVISTDAHNLKSRPPELSVCMNYLKLHCTEEEISLLTWENAWRITRDMAI